LLLLVLVSIPRTASAAATVIVDTTADETDLFDSTCSLREAITLVNSGLGSAACGAGGKIVYDAIQFSAKVKGAIIVGSPLPPIDANVTINPTRVAVSVIGFPPGSVFTI